MERPDIFVEKESSGGKTIYNLIIQGGYDPGPTVLREFLEIANNHSLPPEGGCYNVNAMSLDNSGTTNFLGGMYVQPSKYNGVVADLRSKGYKVITPLSQ